MVSTATIISMFVLIVFSLLLFVGLILFFRKRTGIAAKPVIIGAVGFIVATQVLEKIPHTIVVLNFPHYADHPWLFGLYGGLAAGIFEEFARFLLYTWFLKKYLDYKGGISFGVGWGGIEAVALVLMTVIPYLLFAFMINAGTLDSELGGKLPSEQMAVIKDAVLSHGVSFYLWGLSERFFAVFMQIGFSLLVLIGVVKKKFIYVIYAVLFHAVIDFPVVFWQMGKTQSLWGIELYMAVIGVIGMVFIKKAKQWLPGSFE
ncbi:YhfC family intramembrane metalloprotease [Neobacillus sp. Marseille-QA0830]